MCFLPNQFYPCHVYTTKTIYIFFKWTGAKSIVSIVDVDSTKASAATVLTNDILHLQMFPINYGLTD